VSCAGNPLNTIKQQGGKSAYMEIIPQRNAVCNDRLNFFEFEGE